MPQSNEEERDDHRKPIASSNYEASTNSVAMAASQYPKRMASIELSIESGPYYLNCKHTGNRKLNHGFTLIVDTTKYIPVGPIANENDL